MIALDSGDKIRGDASSANKVDYTLHGVVADVLTQLADGQCSISEADLYMAPSNGTIVTTIIMVNTHTSAITCNLYLKPNGGTSRRIIPKDMEIGIGYVLTFDGINLKVTNQQGTGNSVAITTHPADTFVAEDGVLGKGVLLQGDDGTDRHNVAVDVAGHLQVDVLSDGGSSDSIATEGVAATKGTQISLDDGTDSHYAQANATGDLKVTLDSEAVVLGTGTASIGKLAANTGVDIGNVDVLSLPTLPSGTNAIGKLAANDGVDIGNVDVASQPADTFVAENGALGKGILLQGDDGTDRKNVAVDTDGNVQVDIIGALPAGSAAIGKLAANSGVDIGDVDVKSLPNKLAAWTQVVINISTATTTELIAASAGHTYTIVTVSLTIAAENNLTFKSAANLKTGPMDFGKTGEAHGWQANFWPVGIKCVTGEALNLTTTTTGQVSGIICVLDES